MNYQYKKFQNNNLRKDLNLLRYTEIISRKKCLDLSTIE